MRIRARPIAPGRATGTALVHPEPFSFVGGVDPSTGELLHPTPSASGGALAGRVFAFPHGKGSTVGSYVLYGLGRRGVGPAAIVNARAEAIVAVGAVLAGIPMVDRVDVGGIRSADRVTVDGDRGAVDLPDVRARPVVSAILRNRGRILIVRRSEAVGSFRGRWSAVSGYIEGREDPRDRAVREVREETGLRRLVLRATGQPVFARTDATVYVVHPFLFDVASRTIRLDWENTDHAWIRLEDLGRYDTVPRLADVVASVLPAAASVPTPPSPRPRDGVRRTRSPGRPGRPRARAASSAVHRRRTG
ncbi:MAG TPA: DUF126 domain-containing protein [Thermoplasmata archaeon]